MRRTNFISNLFAVAKFAVAKFAVAKFAVSKKPAIPLHAHPTQLTLLAFIALTLMSCRTGPSREERVANFDALEAQQLEVTAQQEAERRREISEAAKLRREAAERKLQQEIEQQKIIAAYQSNSQATQNSETALANNSDWQLANHPSPIDGEPICALVSKPQLVLHGDLETQVQLIITAATAFVRTDATFNQDGFDTGIQVDGGIPIPYDRYLNEVTAVVDLGYQRLITSLVQGSLVGRLLNISSHHQ